MKKINKLIIVLIIVELTTLASTGIYAYYTYQKKLENTIVLGYNEIQVNEIYEPPNKIIKGETSFKKEPTVKNTGNVDCYVRVKYLVSDSRVENGLNIYYNDKNLKYNSEYFNYSAQDRLLLL